MKKLFSILFMAAFVLILTGCSFGKKDDSDSDTSKYKDAPDTIETCPGCVYSNETASYTSASKHAYEPIPKDKYSSDWKKIAAESDTADVFFGYVLDENDYATRAFVCSVYNNIPYCLEGAAGDSAGGNLQNRIDIYNKNLDIIKTNFNDDCSMNGFVCYPAGEFGKGNNVYLYNPEKYTYDAGEVFMSGFSEYGQSMCASLKSDPDGYTYRINICDTELEDYVNDAAKRG